MCSLIGALIYDLSTHEEAIATNEILKEIFATASERGRDGIGYLISHNEEITAERSITGSKIPAPKFGSSVLNSCIAVIGNTRAEPTTEWVKEKKESDQQPYSLSNWSIVHNGTIANDAKLRSRTKYQHHPTNIDSAAIVELLNDDFLSHPRDDNFERFAKSVQKLIGSYAIIGIDKYDSNSIYLACNYRPIWVLETSAGVFFGSSRNSFGKDERPWMLPPYSVHSFIYNFEKAKLVHRQFITLRPSYNKRALVVCSGGLDSVVSAVYVQKELKMNVELIHFQYGSRAEGPELTAIRAVAHSMGVKLHIRQIPAYDPGDSNLLDANSTIAGGEAGAEFAHEWVPARNLLLLATATAFAEAKKFDYIVLGNNMEEAGAYPDNEPEFIERFQDLLRFAVGSGKFLEILQPVGNLMKHEIVKLGHDLGAPMHLTWSCYRAGAVHCGTCGPCFMRRTAFKINNLDEVLTYEN